MVAFALQARRTFSVLAKDFSGADLLKRASVAPDG
jgi:hypothetical protein